VELSESARLRAPALSNPLHVVLVEPEIPPNTGNVARLCVATGSVLHLVGKLGFRIDAQAVRRAGLDYWEDLELHQHRGLQDAEAALRLRQQPGRAPRSWLLSGRARQSYLDVQFAPGDALVFGKESVGLPPALLEERAEDVVGVPLLGPVRSLNLANAVSIVLYEALRSLGALGNALPAK